MNQLVPLLRVPVLALVHPACEAEVYAHHGKTGVDAFEYPPRNQDEPGIIYMRLADYEDSLPRQGFPPVHACVSLRRHEVGHDCGYKHPEFSAPFWTRLKYDFSVGFDARSMGTLGFRFTTAPRQVLDHDRRCLEEWNTPGNPLVVHVRQTKDDPRP